MSTVSVNAGTRTEGNSSTAERDQPASPKGDSIEGLLERIRHKVMSLKHFQDKAKYQAASGQSIAQEISSLLEEEVSWFSAIVENYWRSGEEKLGTPGKSLLGALSPTLKESCLNLSTGQLMTVDEALEHLHRNRGTPTAEEERIVAIRAICETIDRLRMEAASLSIQLEDEADGGTVSVALARRDLQRQKTVQNWKKTGRTLHRLNTLQHVADLKLILDEVARLDSIMAQHERITKVFPLPPEPVVELTQGSGTTHDPFPYQLADRFVEEFAQTVIFPAVQARTEWAQLATKLQIKAKFRTSASAAEEAQLASAEGKSIESSTLLRQQYNDRIPLLRFGFPELRGKISSLIDEHCGMGALRMDVSTEDFEWTELRPSSGGVCVRRAVTKASPLQKKGLRLEYFIKRFTSADEFHRELEAMRVASNPDGTHHSNVGEVDFAFEEGVGENRFCFLAMPVYPMTSQQWFNTHGPYLVNAKDVVRVLSEIVSGLACLHSHGILHGDLKPDNIMMDGTGLGARPKLIDFNFSTVRTVGVTNALRVVTAPIGVSTNFAPPEFLDPSTVQSERAPASDVYSLGRTFEVLLRNILISSEWRDQLIARWLKRLIRLMTNHSPEGRPALGRSPAAFTGVSVSEWFRSLNKVPLSFDAPRITPLQYLDFLGGSVQSSYEWYGLGFFMKADEVLTVGGKSYSQRQCYMKALNHDPKYSSAWYELGIGMKASEEVLVNGASYTQRQCYLAALKHDPEYSQAWMGLGDSMNASEQVLVNGASYGKQQCYSEALKHDPKDSQAWMGLCNSMNASEEVQIDGASYTQQQCYVEALKHDSKGSSRDMSASEEVKVKDPSYAERQCFVEERDRETSSMWNNLGTGINASGQVLVNGVSYTQRQCCLEALKHYPKNSAAWFNLGAGMNASEQVLVNGASYTQRQCYLEALKHDPKDSTVWHNLGAAMSASEHVQANGASYNKQQCYVEALKHDPKKSATWYNLGSGMNASDQVQVNGASYTQRQCYVEALKHDPKNSSIWNGLGVGMNASDQVQVNGASYTQRQCFVEALKHDPKNSAAWHNLGARINASDQVLVNGVSYTQRRCYLEVLEHDPTYSAGWLGLGNSMNASEQLQINGASYTKRQCYVEAVKHDPKYSIAWYNIGVPMTASEQVQVNGASYTQRQCFVEALKHDPKSRYAWRGLSATMNAFEEVQVNGASYTQQQCYVEALKHDLQSG